MVSKPEKRVRLENSMGPRGFRQISVLKMGPNSVNHRVVKKLLLYSLNIMDYNIRT